MKRYWIELRMDDGEVKGFAEEANTWNRAVDDAFEDAKSRGFRPAELVEVSDNDTDTLVYRQGEPVTYRSNGWIKNERTGEVHDDFGPHTFAEYYRDYRYGGI